MNFPLALDPALISAGMLATLTGFRDYETLDQIREDFREFVEETAGHYERWQDAWGVFWPLYRIGDGR
jgi:hypothetical protein